MSFWHGDLAREKATLDILSCRSTSSPVLIRTAHNALGENSTKKVPTRV